MAKKGKKVKKFSNFPSTIYVHHVDDGGDGYFMSTPSEIDAIEQAVDDESQVATYELVSQANLVIRRTIEEID